MEKTIFQFILKYSLKQQIYLMCLTLLSFPFLYISLELPKTIINTAIGGDDFPVEWHVPYADYTISLDQIPYLFTLSSLFLLLVLVNGGLKYHINVFKGQMGERMLRRLRSTLYGLLFRIPLPKFRKFSPGETIAMVTAEVEPLGGFIGDSFVLPLFQGGTLLVYLTFIFIQDPFLGLAAIFLYPFQFYLIPKLQRKVNQLAKKRVKTMRKIADHIGETMHGMKELQTYYATPQQQSFMSLWLGKLYFIRFEIYRRKFFIKFLNNFLAQLTPFFFYAIGGYLVIHNHITFGALVAVLAAYKDLAAPWKELLSYYEQKEDIKIKYNQVVEPFLRPESDELIVTAETLLTPLTQLALEHVTIVDEQKQTKLSTTNITFEANQHYAIFSEDRLGLDELMMVLSGLESPSTGHVKINHYELSQLSSHLRSQTISYIHDQPYLFTGNVAQNLYMTPFATPLPPELKAHDETLWQEELEKSGSFFDPECVQHQDILPVNILKIVGLEELMFDWGLKRRLETDNHETFLTARKAFKETIKVLGLETYIEPFRFNKYNENASLKENLLFGSFYPEEEGPEKQLFHKALHATHMWEDLLALGFKTSQIMMELFADFDNMDQSFIEDYSFIPFEDLKQIKQQIILWEKESDFLQLPLKEQLFLMSIPMEMVVAKHRLGLIDKAFKTKALSFRKYYKELCQQHNVNVSFFDSKYIHPELNVKDNILFGKISQTMPKAETIVLDHMKALIDKLALHDKIIEIGLKSSVGIAGSRLNSIEKQRLNLARALIKNPQILVINQIFSTLDQHSFEILVKRVLHEYKDKLIIWVINNKALHKYFDYVLLLKNNKITINKQKEA